MKLKYYLRGLGLGILVTTVILWIGQTNKTSMTDEQIKARAAQLGMVESTTLREASDDEEAIAGESLESQTTDSSGIDKPVDLVAKADAAKDDTKGAADTVSETDKAEDTTKTDKIAENSTAEQNNEQVKNDETQITDTKTETNPENKEEPVSVKVTEGKKAAETGEAVDTVSETTEKKQEKQTEEENSDEPKATESQTTEAKTASSTFVIAKGDGSGQVAKKLAEAGLVVDASKFDEYLCSKGYDRKIHTGTYTIPQGTTEADIAQIIVTGP